MTELAIRTAYDTVATDYADLVRAALADNPFDRGVLDIFAELVRGPVLDAGCGPGQITLHLHALGLDVQGIDLSPSMIAVARADHPHLRFDVGRLAALDLPDASLGGLLAWYSVIHTAPEQQPAIFAEFGRVLAPGAPLLLAFQTGADEHVHLDQGYGHHISLEVYRLDPDRVAADLDAAGLREHARLIREPTPPEKAPQTYLVAFR